jgi:5-methylcytosine-specific restriction endonuclease McrA
MDLYFGPGRPPPRAATFDHVTPKSLGGTNEQSNLMLAHSQCNWERGSRTEVRAIDLASSACRHGCQTACIHDEVAGLL